MKKFLALDNCTKKSTKKQLLENCVENLDELQDAGIFFPDSNVVVIDFDGHNSNEKFYISKLKDKFPHTWLDTDRGTHFFFKKNVKFKVKHQAKKLCNCGLIVDFICQKYSVVKRNGIARTGSWDYDLNKLETIPDWLLPFPNKAKDDPIDLVGLKDGDGRHISLFTWLSRIHARLFGVDIGLITNVINDMIFAEQLPIEELKSILESIGAGNYDFENTGIKSVKQSQNVADWLVNQFNVKIYKGKIWHKNGLRYISDHLLLAGELNKTLDLNETDWKKILFKININENIRIPDNKKNHIRIDNGVILKGEFSNINCDEFTPYYIPVFYDPEAYDEHVDKFLNFLSCDDPETRIILEEMLAHIILTETAPHSFFLITGDGNNGKSTFLNMIERFVDELCSSVTISNFGDPNSIVKMMDKIVNIDDDIDPDYLEKSKTLKCIASGDGTLEVKTLFENKRDVKIHTTLIFTANKPPNWKDKSYGLYRRLNIIHLDNNLSDEEKDPELLEKLSTNSAKQYILRLALEGVQRFKKNNMKISHCEKAQMVKDQYMIESDPMLYWYDDNGEDLTGQTLTYAVELFNSWASRNGCKTMSVIEFGRRLKNIGYCTKHKREGNKRPKKIFKL